mmetsp:Transcript_21447/g.36538  ORF Transcript_21447/g.36538 Transcript_21447/m.36538 type:complete len:117 (-) Transcript_21447:61-411(-)
MLSSRSNTLSIRSADGAIFDLEQQINLLDSKISPLRNTVQKKLDKIEDEIANCNFLIDSGIGSKSDKAGLRKTKRQLRQSRIKLWDDLKYLPALEEERRELVRELNAMRRRHGILL